MVLENASDSTPNDSLYDSAPPSDDDPYSSSETQSKGNYNIDRSQFPKPIPILGPLFGYTDQLFSKVLQQKVQTASNALKRPLSQEETSAFAYWTAKQISIFSYGPPLGIAAGLWRAYSTAPLFRFPFWQPNLEKLQPDAFPPKMPIMRGNRAVLAWHAVRGLAYGAVGNYIAQILFGSYSMSVAAVGELSDPRLKAMVEAVRQQAQQRRGSLPNPRGGQPGTVDGAQQRGGVRIGKGQQDDASPTGGVFGDENESLSKETSNGVSEDNVGGAQAAEGRWPGLPRSRPTPAPRSVPETQSQPFDAFDDASPTSGQGVVADTTTPQSSGSAWDRIRRGEKPTSAPKPDSGWQSGRGQQQSRQSAWSKQSNDTQQEQREGSTTGDSFTFSKTGEERGYAKEEAQKEFDARVDKERRGGDFSQGSGDQRRW
jgi:hypothetical protein